MAERDDFDDRLVWNGLDGVLGEPIRPAVEPSEVGRALLAGRARMDFGSGAKSRSRAEGYERWGVVYAPGTLELRPALEPLLAWRRKGFGDRVGEFELAPADKPRRSVSLKPIGRPRTEVDDPDYLLLVGDPETLPWENQYLFDQARAVGRLAFDTVDDYERYARSVVAAESGHQLRDRSLAFLGPRFEGDRATELSADELLAPLGASLAVEPGWRVRREIGPAATKARLRRLLGGTETPALLFTASHGLAFPADDERQVDQQGALVCADWPGTGMGDDHFFAARDVGDELDVAGAIVFAFGCCTAGTPAAEGFAQALGRELAAPMAPRAFVSALSRRLLAHPAGGALAFIGHVDLAWPYSYRLAGGREVYLEALRGLLQGRTVGDALHGFGARYGDILFELTEALEQPEVDPRWLGILWIAARDARSYVLVGDPAVRLAVRRSP
jgi:hypothetical protein